MLILVIFSLTLILIAISYTDAEDDTDFDYYMNSDLSSYNYGVYRKLFQEYEYELHRTTRKIVTSTIKTTTLANQPIEPTTEESLEKSVIRLQCEYPHFWNSFKCLYLDVRLWSFSERSRRNGKTVGIILLILSPLFILICSPMCFCCYYYYRMRKFKKKMDKFYEKYYPGIYVYEDGTIEKYPATPEEVKAFENLIAAVATVV